ncbi:PLD nuclease N-terminal domain-containing protein [Streptomyces sp. NPDC001068]|uniref:PLD nuclease N-terminal domain-containing protein n=1 Tax=Streptomyces sp. NPDC001068 TaxID=3364544 RepID=UPI0036B59FD1
MGWLDHGARPDRVVMVNNGNDTTVEWGLREAGSAALSVSAQSHPAEHPEVHFMASPPHPVPERSRTVTTPHVEPHVDGSALACEGDPMTTLLVGAIYVMVGVLYIYALGDCVRTPAARMRMLPKAGWLIIMILFPILGAIAWRNLGKRAAPAEGRPTTS